MLRYWIVFIFSAFLFSSGFASELFKDVVWKHFTTEDGLSQNSVMSILQDKKGYLWFSTWNGLSRYDGYNFKSYKIRSGDEVFMTNSRIDKIIEDKYGCLWLITYGQNVVHFNPDLEKFQNILPSEYSKSQILDVKILESGVAWVISKSDGAFRVETDNETKELTFKAFSAASGNIHSNSIAGIYLDSENNEWILSDNGITKLSNNAKSIDYYYVNNIHQGDNLLFYSFLDDKHYIFFGCSGGQVVKYDKTSKEFGIIKLPVNSPILKVFYLSKTELLVVSKSGRLFKYDKSIDKYDFVSKIFDEGSVKIGHNFHQLSNGDVWIQFEKNKLVQYKKKEDSVKFHYVATLDIDNTAEPVFMMHEDINNVVWIHPFGGGFYYYEKSEDSLIRFFNRDKSNIEFVDQLHSMFSDNQGNLWMSTRSKGLEQFVFPKKEFKVEEVVSNPQYINDNDVRTVFNDSHGYVWVSTKSGRLAVYYENKLLGFLNSEGRISKNAIFSSSIVYSIMEDRDGYLWISTKGDGIIRAKVTYLVNDFKVHFEHFRNNPNDKYSLSNNNVYQSHQDSYGRIWVASFGGGLNLIEKNPDGTIKFINYKNDLTQYPFETCHRVRYLTSTSKGDLLIGTTHGLLVAPTYFNQYSDLEFVNYTYKPSDSNCLTNNDVHSILESSEGEVYIATFGGGLNKIVRDNGLQNLKFKSYGYEDGLQAEVLLSLLEDENGIIWMPSESGLTQFDVKTQQFRYFNKIDFSKTIGFSEGDGVLTNEGKIIFSTNKGILSFYPDSISKNEYVPSIVFTEFRLSNELQKPEPNGVLKQHINTTSVLNLKHNQNFFSIGFAAIDLRIPESITYYAKLDGFDKNWVILENQRILNFTNIPVGEYTLRVKSTNSDGILMENERTIQIIISPSFWNTPTAYLIYLIIFVLSVILSIYIPLYIYKLKHKIILDNQISEMKLEFFTDISHELRTPLTLILSPLENLLNDSTLKNEHKVVLETIERNSSRMLRLINQLLDFVKISHKKLTLTVEKIFVPSFVNSVVNNFNFLASEQNINLKIIDNSTDGMIWVDVDKLEKILFNLLSNSFKYIGNGKSVEIKIDEDEDNLVIQVSDDGIGIDENMKKNIFERFENSLSKIQIKTMSSGIGLSFVREMVNLHKGDIYYRSNELGGSIFTVKFKKGLNHFDKNTEILEESVIIEIEEHYNVEVDKENSVDVVIDEKATTLLLVEDNNEVRRFIKGILEKRYNIIEANNGMQGLNLAKEFLPDIIVSDLMMPVMSGDVFLKEVRNDIETSHIPFVLLTAKTDQVTKIENINLGVDDYITKPFSPAYLLSKIENLIEQRRKLQLKYLNGLDNKVIVDLQPSEPEVTCLDQKFLDDLKQLMEENIENSSLIVEDLVEQMAISRSVFFKKLKTLTGLSPIEYIKEIRLNRAVQLLESGQYNMSQITYMVGLNDPRYFSKVFKQKYGCTPSEYKKSKSKL